MARMPGLVRTSFRPAPSHYRIRRDMTLARWEWTIRIEVNDALTCVGIFPYWFYSAMPPRIHSTDQIALASLSLPIHFFSKRRCRSASDKAHKYSSLLFRKPDLTTKSSHVQVGVDKFVQYRLWRVRGGV